MGVMDDYGMPEVGKIEYNGPGSEPSPMGVTAVVAAVGIAIYAGAVWSVAGAINYALFVNVYTNVYGVRS